MSKAKLTPWFDGDVKPVRVGWYEREHANNLPFNYACDYWNGKKWLVGWNFKSYSISKVQNKPWRGLASRPR